MKPQLERWHWQMFQQTQVVSVTAEAESKQSVATDTQEQLLTSLAATSRVRW